MDMEFFFFFINFNINFIFRDDNWVYFNIIIFNYCHLAEFAHKNLG